MILILITLFSRFINIYICTKLLNKSRKEPIDAKKQFFLWFAGCRGAMAFALSIKSIIDFPEKGKVFLVLTLIIALFTLIYSTLFLDYTLNECGIINKNTNENINDIDIDNDSINNSNILSIEKKTNGNCFDLFKIKIINFNKNYLKKYIKKTKGINNNRNNSNNLNTEIEVEIEDVYVINKFSKKFNNNNNNNYNDYNSNNSINSNSNTVKISSTHLRKQENFYNNSNDNIINENFDEGNYKEKIKVNEKI